jgi:hypothetical protein
MWTEDQRGSISGGAFIRWSPFQKMRATSEHRPDQGRRATFLDELAFARMKDPLDNLLEILGPPRKVSLDDLGVASLPNYGHR